jgi:hypothetical protein
MTQCLSKHEKWANYTSCSSKSLHQKVTLSSSKSLVYIVFRPNKRSPTSPEDLASFWDQIPLQMAKISSKIQSGKNYRQKPTVHKKSK